MAACLALPLPAAAEFRLESSDQWTGAGGYDAVSADLDGDGKTDYVTARNGPNGIHINQGGGVFHQVQALGSGETRGLAVGDVDNDGDGDIVAANQGQNVRVWVQNDQGRFTTSDSSAFSYAWAVSLADFNRDGNLDAFLATLGNNAGRVLKGHGDGTFTDQGTIPGSYDASDVAVGKFDGDADMDIAVATGSGEPISIKENTGAPSTDLNFTEATTFLTAQTSSIDVGDITGDGNPDIVVDNSGGEKCWAKNDGAGNVTFSVKDPTAPDEEPCGNLVDVDGANELDVVLPKDGGNKVYTNDGTGTFSDTGQSLGGLNTFAIAPIDADGDSDRDFLAVGGVGVALWDNDNGDAQFSSAIQPFGQSSDARAVDLADMDGDGDRDAVLGQKNHLKRLWFNDAGTFSYLGVGQGASTATQGLALADLDADGDADLVTANTSGDANRIVVNGSNGGSLTSSQTLGSNDSGDVALADLDGDGDRDSVFANLASTGNTAYTNDGSGSFSDTGQSLGSATSRAVALGDLDGDGNRDAVFGNDGGNNVYLGSVSGDFTPGASGLGDADTWDVAAIDTDGDGDLDIVAANDNAALQIWHNDGAAQFSKGPSLAVIEARAVAPVDLDGDGVKELYIGRDGRNRLAERSGGSWTLRSRKLGYHDTRDVAAGDIDGDGTPDVVTAQDTAAQQVWLTQDAGRIRLKQASYSAAESDGSVTLTVERTGPDGSASIDYATKDGGAVAVDDYSPASGTLSWADGEAGDKTVTIDLTADGIAEPDEDFTLQLSNLAGSGSAPEPTAVAPQEATVTIAGTNLAPNLSDRDVATQVNQAVDVDVAASDPNGDSLSYTVKAKPAHGSVSLAGTTATYTPETGYSGSDRFEIEVADGQGGTAVAAVSVTVSQGDNTPPEINDETLDLNKNETGTVALFAQDADDDKLTYRLSQLPSHGVAKLSPDAEEVTYDPARGYNGRDSFTVEVADGQGGTATATIRVEVGKVPNARTSSGGGGNDGGCTLSRGNAAGPGPLWALLLLGPWAWQRRRGRAAA